MDGLHGILFDFGGTLDAPGLPWFDRFASAYAALGVRVPEEALRAACGLGTREAYASPALAGFDLRETVAFHVRCQLRSLGIADARLARHVARRFLSDTEAALAESRALLERWSRRFRLGVVSNFYGNLDRILADAGIAPHLTAVLDSTVIGVAKPAPEIFARALERLGVAPGEVLFVGDSLEKDVAPARRAGMRTAWLAGAHRPPAARADACLATLADLEPLLP